MTVIQGDDVGDLVTVTLRELGRLRWTDVSSDLQEHVALPLLLQRERVGFGSGYGIQWNVMTQTSGAAKDTGLFNVDDVNVADVMTTANLRWSHVTTNYAFDRRELAMNREPARVVELVRIRRSDAMIDLAEHVETRFWSKPDSSSDNEKMHGVTFWLPPATAGEEGFTNNLPSGFTDIAGITPSNDNNWQHWAADYAAVTKEDLVRKWRKAATFTNFKSPVPVSSYNTGDRFGYFTNYDVIGPLEEALEAQNDNLGNDMASKDGMLHFRGTPVRWVPQLENDTTDPVYGLNFGVFKPTFLRGEYMRETGPRTASNQHNVMQVHVDLTMNIVCRDRRRNFILSKVA